jgi:hypothetical protein
VTKLFRRLRGVLIAFAALALSAGLAFGAQPETGWGLSNASAHAGKTVPVKAGQVADEETDEDTEDLGGEDTDEDVEDDAGGGGEHCSTDPTALTPEELAELNHGSIVCWAAHQKEWPEWFKTHGKHVSCWAHQGKAEAPSCTEDPNAEPPVADEDAAATSNGHGRGQGKGHNK